MARSQRFQNERKFGNWEELSFGGRRYWLDVSGQNGWWARYIKEVDSQENTTLFLQQIFDGSGRLMQIHEKYPVDKGHRQVEE